MESIGKRNFVNINLVSRHLFCSICSEVFLDPVRTECGHTFCKQCISSCIKYAPHCPICRNVIHSKTFESGCNKDLIAANIINDMEVFCVNRICPWKGTLGNLKNHFDSCMFDDKRCPEELKEILKIEDSNKSKNELEFIAEENTDKETFNLKSSLTQRLIAKNPKILNEKKKKVKRDSLSDFILNFSKKKEKTNQNYLKYEIYNESFSIQRIDTCENQKRENKKKKSLIIEPQNNLFFNKPRPLSNSLFQNKMKKNSR